MEPLLAVSEVLRLLNVSRTTLYRRVWDGSLTPIYVDSHPRFAPEDVRAFIASRRGRKEVNE
jgi:excisionase family DNA binding protein